MWYYLENNEIKMTASNETDLCKSYTDEEIVSTFDNKLVFKHETETNEYIKRKQEFDLQEELDSLKQQREIECFPIINRGKLWYDNLTEQQLLELDLWYKAWLDVTNTKQIPIKPEWL